MSFAGLDKMVLGDFDSERYHLPIHHITVHPHETFQQMLARSLARSLRLRSPNPNSDGARVVRSSEVGTECRILSCLQIGSAAVSATVQPSTPTPAALSTAEPHSLRNHVEIATNS